MSHPSRTPADPVYSPSHGLVTEARLAGRADVVRRLLELAISLPNGNPTRIAVLGVVKEVQDWEVPS